MDGGSREPGPGDHPDRRVGDRGHRAGLVMTFAHQSWFSLHWVGPSHPGDPTGLYMACQRGTGTLGPSSKLLRARRWGSHGASRMVHRDPARLPASLVRRAHGWPSHIARISAGTIDVDDVAGDLQRRTRRRHGVGAMYFKARIFVASM